jgi:dipeptidyl aminopeptidase/acylaminoacyl peptidase
VPQLLIQGTEDDQIPAELPPRWAEKSQRLGDTVTLSMIPSADHLDVVDPESAAWGTVREGVRKMVFS